jgi:hypothetical protein
VCWQFAGVKRVNVAANTLSEGTDAGDTLLGISALNIKGICASGNYLIAYSEQTISWSNPTNPMDFVPSLITGAGTATPSDLKGRIVECIQTANGFIIYTTQNAVSAVASGNTQYPFIFKHIAGSTGLRTSEDAVSDEIGDAQIAWTTDGFHQVAQNGVTTVLPEVTDFIRARRLETYNRTTMELTTVDLTAELHIAIHRLSERFLVISYGTAAYNFSYALVYDSALKRWGKLAIAHAEIILLPSDHVTGLSELCFVASTGATHKLSLTSVTTPTTRDGVAVFGRLALTRTSALTVQKVTVETTDGNAIVCALTSNYFSSLAIPRVVTRLTNAVTPGGTDFYGRVTGKDLLLHLTGAIKLTCVEITTTQSGVR